MSVGGPDLATVIAALDRVIEHGRGLLDPDHLDDAAALRARIDERVRHGDELTVVALAGGTGVGKSALVNRLAGAQVATEGVRRPTTNHPVAVAAELDAPARALLDDLAIDDRRVGHDRLPPGMVLVDLPDHDSTVAEHRATSARLAARVDALVVVVDPIKYARADLHDGPLAELSRHAEVVTVALNRSDELRDDDVDRIRTDLASRLDADGLADVELVTTSAATGAGVDQLRERLVQLVASRRAAVRRLIADAAQLADRMATTLAPARRSDIDVDALVAPLIAATDAARSGAGAASAYRRMARVACRSPLARAVRLPGRFAAEVRGAFVAPDPPTHSPSRTAATIEAALAAQLGLGEATGQTHAALAEAIERISDDAAPVVVDAVDGVPRRPSHRAWWTLLAVLRGVAEVVTLGGLLWLVLLGVARWLQLPELPVPEVTDELSLPAALFLYGLAARVLLGVISRVAVLVGARRHAQRVSTEVRRRLGGALEANVLDPVETELGRQRTVTEQLAVLQRRTT